MKKMLALLLLVAALLGAEEPYGYVAYSTINIGDDIQAVAAKRFLPADALPIDREFIHEFRGAARVNAVVSGWFMHHRGNGWYLAVPPPKKWWPPAAVINPFFISIHLTPKFLSTVFSEENIAYLKEHSPIGARDLFTLNELQKRGVPSYFSGCLTLTLENPYKERDNVVYLVDLDKKCTKYLKSVIKSPVVSLTHVKGEFSSLSHEQRLEYAEGLLELYRKAKCVVTSRLHAAMPCLALGTPVVLIPKEGDPRFSGLKELVWNCSQKELCEGALEYDFDNPPENPKDYLPIRENLIRIMTEWVQSK